MKPTVTILVCVLGASLASAQSPSIVQHTRDTMNGVNSNATAASNQALGIERAAPARPTATRAKSSDVVLGAKNSGEPKRSAGVVARRNLHPKHGLLVQGSNVPTSNVAARPALAGRGVPEGATTAAVEQQLAPDTQYRANGRRDPFISPVVSHAGGSGCSTGKKCLEIGAINLRGVVRSENGFIAVVSNGLNKAYFLRENDPVFNGYVVKITGDSVVFQETLQDRLGKTFTREIVKKITTPAV
jgi:hypothetical protein